MVGLMENIKCKTCKHCMIVHIKNGQSQWNNDIYKVICLVYPDIFDDLSIGMYEGIYPRVTECSMYEKRTNIL
jgi:hypothetical protein